jgi:transcription antitermination factor NusG
MNQLQIASQNAKQTRQTPAFPVRTLWAVVHTHPHAERWAVTNIERLGYRCYLPTYAATRIHRTMRLTVELPLFSRYAFVALAQGEPWTPVRYAQGVAQLLMNDGKPHYARAASVEALQAGEAARRTPVPDAARWTPGQPCVVAAGPLEGRDAIVLTVRKKTANIAVMALGDLRRISIPIAWIQPR